MSSVERDDARAGELIERLLIDPAFRAEFRRDPATACAAAGLPDLADELAGSAGSIDPLAVRESRSSLAGVVMAVAVEGISVAEAQALMQHGLTGAPRGSAKLLHGGALRRPLGHVPHAGSPASLERELRGLRGGSPVHGAGAAAGHAVPAASTASTSPAATAAQDHASPSAPSASSAAQDPSARSAASAPSGPATPGAPQDHPASPAAAPTTPASSPPPEPGAQPARGGVVPAWPDEQPGGAAGTAAPPAGGMAEAPAGGAGTSDLGGATSSASGVLDSPQLSAPPEAQAFLAGGGADPRLVAVLSSALANHSIGLGQVTTFTDPVPMQVVSIVSVDGQPVGPSNFAARDLVTELAALDPSLRPSEIGTPWPIHAAGFFTDPAHQGQLRLAFLPGSEGAAPAAPAGIEPTPTTEPPTAAAPPAEPSTAAAPPQVAPTPAPNAGQYVSPLPASAQIGRTDMGVDVDLNPGDPIVAPGTSRVLGIMPNWYHGQPYVALQLLDGPMKGHNYYIAEQITPDVSVGQVVQQGQPIGHYAASGTGIEMGWAGPNWEQTLAQATSGYSEGEQTAAGDSFHRFLEGLGHGEASAGTPAATDLPPATDPPPVTDPPPITAPAPGGVTDLPPPTGQIDHTPPGYPPGEPPILPEPGHSGRIRHTVQFLPAVQPSPGSPLYGQVSEQVAAEPPSADQAALPQPSADQAPAAQPSATPVPDQPAPASLLDQAPAPATPAGPISVSSSLLTPGQEKFAGKLAELTGLDPHVVAAWELAEESGSAAQGREAASNFNWLNIGYFDSGAGKIAFDRTFSDPISAAEQSAKFLKGEWGGASSSIRAILNSVGHSADEQMAAIANSDWASSHYGGGANLHGTYDELSDIRIEKSTVT